jgi:RimJ/RimL family protein N-acetyltransferase
VRRRADVEMTITKPLPDLHGESLTLRPLGTQDAAAMYNALADPEAMRLTGTHGHFTAAAVHSFCASLDAEEDRVDYAVYLHGADHSSGEIVLNDIDADNRSANFRTALYGSSNFGRGIGSEAIPLVLAYGFDAIGLHRIELEVFDFNLRARHLYQKLGFEQEGIKRDALCWQGVFHDAIVMSLLAPDFRR